MKHPSGIPQAIVDKMVARRGRLHAYSVVDSEKTALVVVDLDRGTVRRMREEGDVSDMLGRINDLAKTVREMGGVVAWVTTETMRAGHSFRAILGEKSAQMYESESASGEAVRLASELDVQNGDIRAIKQGYSAFFPGKSDLHEQLQKYGVDTVLIAGTVTDVCCESSARDAYELDYKVIMVSDALQGRGCGLHEAALAVIFRNFGDVRPAEEVLQLLA
jgi:nicotinamidase-related amidase